MRLTSDVNAWGAGHFPVSLPSNSSLIALTKQFVDHLSSRDLDEGNLLFIGSHTLKSSLLRYTSLQQCKEHNEALCRRHHHNNKLQLPYRVTPSSSYLFIQTTTGAERYKCPCIKLRRRFVLRWLRAIGSWTKRSRHNIKTTQRRLKEVESVQSSRRSVLLFMGVERCENLVVVIVVVAAFVIVLVGCLD